MKARQPSLTIVRRIKAAPATVFDAWVRPERIARWWGPDSGPVLLAETDLRVGGRFRIVFETLDGEQHDCGGEYLEIERDRLLLFSWQWASTADRRSLVRVELLPVNGDTELVFTHSNFADEEAMRRHLEGWIGALDKLEMMFANRRIVR